MSAIDPEDWAFKGLLRGIRTNCTRQHTTSRADIQKIVDYYKPRYPQLTADLILESVQSVEVLTSRHGPQFVKIHQRGESCNDGDGEQHGNHGGTSRGRGRDLQETHQSSTPNNPPILTLTPEERYKIVHIPPGKLGVTGEFDKCRAIVTRINPSCAFKDEVQVGDCIATIDGRKFCKPEVARIGIDRTRQLGIIHTKASALPSVAAAGSPSGINVAQKRKRDENGNMTCNKAARGEKVQEKQKQESENQEHIQAPHADSGWEHRCQQLQHYKENHTGKGDIHVPIHYKAPDDLTLGEWMETQRKLFREGQLEPDKVEYLQSNGFSLKEKPSIKGLSTGDSEWVRKLEELMEYREIHGHCNVPKEYPNGITLGQWVCQQRELYNEGTLDEGRHLTLENKGFKFEPGTNVQKTVIDKYWKDNFDELKQFKVDHGHLEIPTDYKATSLSVYLDRWLSLQKKNYRHKTLSRHKIRMLEELGLDFTMRKKHDATLVDKKWDAMFEELLAYREEHGDCLVPTNQGKLGRWIRVQRKYYNKGELPENRLQRLVAVGFDFDPLNKSAADANFHAQNESSDSIFTSPAWNKNYEAMKTFIESNGHADVPARFKGESIEGDLHAWVETQKKFYDEGILPSQQIEMLEGIGVDLSGKSNYSASRRDIDWENMFGLLQKFHETEGHTNVPMSYHHQLSRWTKKQREYYRDKKLLEYRQLKLESLGMDFSRKRRRRRSTRGKVEKKLSTEGENADQQKADLESMRGKHSNPSYDHDEMSNDKLLLEEREEARLREPDNLESSLNADKAERYAQEYSSAEQTSSNHASKSRACSYPIKDFSGDDYANDLHDGVEADYELEQLEVESEPEKCKRPRRHSKQRCRRCGKRYSTPEWIGFHKNNIPNGEGWNRRTQNPFLRNSPGNKVWDHCTVAESDFEPGFPCYDGRMPRVKKGDDTG